jgi:alkylated DNA repair protein alkB family protein 8
MLKRIFTLKFFKGVFRLDKNYSSSKKLLSFTMENDNKIKLDDNCQSKNEQKLKQKSEKKSNKKLAKAIHVLKFHEGGENMKREIFSKTIQNKLWIYHFGNGDEDDQKSIKEYFTNKFGSNKIKIYIFPGISYGFLEFEDLSVLEKIPISGMIDKTYPFYDFSIDFASGHRKIFAFYSNISLNEVKENNTSTFPIASFHIDIPGLYIMDDFITEEEEKALIESIDLNEWTKLTNRKVQHYGYEFIYGANNVNKKNQIGDLPTLGVDMKTSKHKIN